MHRYLCLQLLIALYWGDSLQERVLFITLSALVEVGEMSRICSRLAPSLFRDISALMGIRWRRGERSRIFRSTFTPSANLNLFILCLFLIKRKPVQLNYHLLDKLMQDDRVRDL